MKTLMQPVLYPVQPFGQCLKEMLKEKRISASEVARLMAYKSRNSVFRILDGTGGHSVCEAFFEKLKEENPLALSEEGFTVLAQALEVTRVGEHAFMSNRAMRELLMNVSLEPEEHRVRIDASNTPEDPRFHDALDAMAQGRKAYLTITGCCDRPIFDALREHIYKTDLSCEVKVRHIVYTGAEEIVHNISAIQPLLYSDVYTAYCLEPGMFSKERESVFRMNCVYLHIQDAQGQWYNQMIPLVDKGVFIAMRRTRGGGSEPFQKYFKDDLARMPLLKADFSKAGRLEDYQSYTQACRQLERNRAIYTIKPDVPLNFIHPDILLPCVAEGFAAMGEDDPKGFEAFLREIERIHLARWENFFSKKKVNHTIFSREAMEQFARTGRQSDHFFAIRPYTGQERTQILTHLRKQEAENPHFHIHFFKEDFTPPLTEIGLYEGVGTLLTKPYTHYNLADDHAEAVLTQPEFCECYKEFFVKDLLAKHVVSREETLHIMDQLIEIARQA
ncbi:MAG: hypothetical protein IJB85_06390 [Clostridia bacterium]|nr:hypothetical protein [Clostridia bacterium]